MLDIFTGSVLPVFIIAGIGAVIGRKLNIDPRPIGRLALYVFAPALVFSSLSSGDTPIGDMLDIFAFQALWLPLLYAVCWLLAWRSGLRGSGRSAFLLSTMFMNAVNYGLPVSLLAFGEEGLNRALLFLVPQALMSGTLAVYVASRSGLGPKQALLAIVRLPMFYATTAALAINPFDVTLPAIISTPLDILGAAAIPTMIIALGIQIARASLTKDLLPAGAATVVRLVISPALAYGVTLLLGITGVSQQVVVVLAGMPTAVYTTLLATEFHTNPRQVTSAVALSTGASMATITALVWLMLRLA